MSEEKDEKYWKDYTDFISETEKLTRLSPGELIFQYRNLLSKFKKEDELFFGEWQYEFQEVVWVRQEIQKVINFSSLRENSLLKSFKLEIQKIDSEIKNYVQKNSRPDWWNIQNITFVKSIN